MGIMSKPITKEDLELLLRDGWRPRIKMRANGKRYITVRKRVLREYGLGPYTDELWNMILSIFPPRVTDDSLPELLNSLKTDADKVA